MKLTSEDCAALQAKIADLTTSYEDLLSGRKARVLVDQNGERIEYNGGDSRRLWVYIQSLKAQYAEGCRHCTKAMSRPIRPFF